MSIEATSSISALQSREYLASPFTQKAVNINSKTPYDKVEENVENKAYSRDYFNTKTQAKLQYSPSEIKQEVNEIKPEIINFSKSSLSSQDMVNNALQKGYSTNQAVNIVHAQAAYSRSAFLTNNPVGVLNTCSYTVS